MTGIGDDRTPHIFRNVGATRTPGSTEPWFVEVTDQIMPVREPASVSLFADLDNDGDLDIVASRRFVSANYPLGNHREVGIMYYENVAGTFVPGTSDPTLGYDPSSTHGGLALADVDNDSDLDIVFAHNGGGNGVGGPGFYIRNDGLPNLVDDTAGFGADLSQITRYFSVVLADFNGDLLPDLHAAVDFFSDYHARNMGNGTFMNVTTAVNATHLGSDMGLSVGDFDNDGDFDIYSTNINEGVLYVNDGQGTFQNEAGSRGCAVYQSGFGAAVIGWGTAFVDFDHDRDLDIVVTAYGEPGHLFENDGTGHYQRVTNSSGMTELLGHGLVPFDYDNDGDVDVLLMRTGLQLPTLYENRTVMPDRHWLTIELEGTRSNRNGVGARIEVHTPDGVRMTRNIMAGSSFKSGPPMNAHFGMGNAIRARQIRVFWPSGTVQTMRKVLVDRVLRIVEP